MTHCPVKAFDGCHCAPGECQSLTVRLEKHRADSAAFTREYLLTSVRIGRVLAMSVIGCGALFGAFVHAEWQFRDQDKRQQEITGQYARVMRTMEITR